MSDRTDITKREESVPVKSRKVPSITPVVDIFENEDEILLHADMPGVDKENLTINIDNGRLSISGGRNINTDGVVNWEEFIDVEYLRTFSVPQTIDVEKVNAKLKDGVLKLHLPKSEAAKPRHIEIH